MYSQHLSHRIIFQCIYVCDSVCTRIFKIRFRNLVCLEYLNRVSNLNFSEDPIFIHLISECQVWKAENTAVGIRHADHVALSDHKKLALTSPTSGGRSVGIVRSRTQATEFF
jgi:hypothetical protein